jgi:uncharacterized protein (TIGR00288 family)
LEETPSIAVFADYENIAIGVRDARYARFDIDLVLARLLEKGKVIIKKAYSDWSRYESAKKPMHEAAFELVEVPHVSYSGKNSADIRLVVDALDLCHTKPHIQIFAIISGDSDFSPLVSKLRENNKAVIGVGVKSSTSLLLIESCDEFIFYDDLVRDEKRGKTKKTKQSPRSGDAPPPKAAAAASAPAQAPAAAVPPVAADVEGKKEEALDLVLDTVEALFRERDESVWGSHVKQVLKRKRPQFSEGYYGYASFNELLEDAAVRKLLEIEKDDKSGGYVIHAFGENATVD